MGSAESTPILPSPSDDDEEIIPVLTCKEPEVYCANNQADFDSCGIIFNSDDEYEAFVNYHCKVFDDCYSDADADADDDDSLLPPPPKKRKLRQTDVLDVPTVQTTPDDSDRSVVPIEQSKFTIKGNINWYYERKRREEYELLGRLLPTGKK